MTDRLYAIVADLTTAEKAIAALKQAGLAPDSIGVLCKDQNVAESQLPEADLSHTSEVGESAARGAAIGGATGLLAGLAAIAFPPAGLVLGGAALAGITVAGGGVGAWSATMIGISEQSGALEQVDQAVEAGKVLVIANKDESSDKSLESALEELRNAMGTSIEESGIAKK